MTNSRFFTIATISLLLLATPSKAQDALANIASSLESTTDQTTTFTLWNGGYDKTDWQIGMGYVNKSWICTYETGTQREDFFGDSDDKFIHGFQIGALYTPSFDWGLGLRTGLFLEFYISHSKWITDYCSSFEESDMYIPLQASYRIPFNEECCLNVFAGPAFQWAMKGRYLRQVGTSWRPWRRPIPIYEGYEHQYGNGWPQKVNWQLDCGLQFRYSYFTLGFTYSFGLSDHGIQTSFDGGTTYVTAIRSRQDKMQVTVAVAF